MRFASTFGFALCLVSASLGFFESRAAELAGVTMPATATVGGEALVLNGMGIRKAYLTIKVYVAGLYLKTKSSDAEAILKTTTPKRLDMEFKMVVERAKIVEAWEKGYKDNCTKSCGDE